MTELEDSLKQLITHLFKHFNKKVIVLIDEYDAPINNAFLHDCSKPVIKFMKGFLGNALKTNDNLERTIMTGVLPFAKADLYSSLNHVETCDVLSESFSQHYGFTEQEIQRAIMRLPKPDYHTVKNMYSGYTIGDVTLFNAWSIMKYLQHRGKLNCYWFNTGSPDTITSLLSTIMPSVINDINTLLSDNTIQIPIEQEMTLDNLTHNTTAFWMLLLHTGYLTSPAPKKTIVDTYSVKFPNLEVRFAMANLLARWLEQQILQQNIVDTCGYYQSLAFALPLARSEYITALMPGFILALYKNLQSIVANPEFHLHRYCQLSFLAKLFQFYRVAEQPNTGLPNAEHIKTQWAFSLEPLPTQPDDGLSLQFYCQALAQDASDEIMEQQARQAIATCKQTIPSDNAMLCCITVAGKRVIVQTWQPQQPSPTSAKIMDTADCFAFTKANRIKQSAFETLNVTIQQTFTTGDNSPIYSSIVGLQTDTRKQAVHKLTARREATLNGPYEEISAHITGEQIVVHDALRTPVIDSTTAVELSPDAQLTNLQASVAGYTTELDADCTPSIFAAARQAALDHSRQHPELKFKHTYQQTAGRLEQLLLESTGTRIIHRGPGRSAQDATAVPALLTQTPGTTFAQSSLSLAGQKRIIRKTLALLAPLKAEGIFDDEDVGDYKHQLEALQIQCAGNQKLSPEQWTSVLTMKAELESELQNSKAEASPPSMH